MKAAAHPPAGPRGEKPGQPGPRGEKPGSGGPTGPNGEKPGQAGPRGETPGSGGSSNSSSSIRNDSGNSQDELSSELKDLIEKLKRDHESGNTQAEQQDQQRIRALMQTLGGAGIGQ